MQKKVEHQLKKTKYYIPDWKVSHLFIGTFNPNGGESVNYYYGRSRNKTWQLLSIIFKEEISPNKKDFFAKLKKHGIGCIDLIDTVEAEEKSISHILGKGYKDSAIINTSVNRNYNTEHIFNVINSNPQIKIYSTWGKGPNLKEWKNEIGKIKSIVHLVSPSLASRVPKGQKKFDYMLNDWSNKIIT